MIRVIHLLIVASMSFVIAGCPGKRVRPDGSNGDIPSTAGPVGSVEGMNGDGSSVFGPEAPPGPLPAPDYVPPQDGVVLVLGPGLARGLAYIGVLSELEERGVPIRGIVGVEFGALIAGVWASSNQNNLEWELHKFKRQTLLDLPILGLGEKIAEGRKLYGFLDRAIKVDLLQKLKVPVIVASGVKNSGSERIVTESTGSAKDVIRGALGIPGIIRSYTWNGKERITAALESPFPAQIAKELGIGKVMCVDVVGPGDNFNAREEVDVHLAALMRSVSTIARSQLTECDINIAVPMDGVGYLSFDSKADLIYRGKLAIRKWLKEAE